MKYLLILLILISACQSLPDNQVEKMKIIYQSLKIGSQAMQIKCDSALKYIRNQYKFREDKENKIILAKINQLALITNRFCEAINEIEQEIEQKTPEEYKKMILNASKQEIAEKILASEREYHQFFKENFPNIPIELPTNTFPKNWFQSTTKYNLLCFLSILKYKIIIEYEYEVLNDFLPC
jgi:hypothetical protein